MKKSPVLVVAAHPDDEVLGCGGTIAKFALEGRPVHVLLLADGESSRESNIGFDDLIQNRNASAEKAADILGISSLKICEFPDNRLDSINVFDVVKIIEASIRDTLPTTVFTHHYGDVNVDHRVVHEAVLAACRPQPGFCVKELFFFEIPSSTEWRPPNSATPFVPNLFVNIDIFLDTKKKALLAYASEMRDFPHARSIKAVEALARWRGACVGKNAAEAFMVGRIIN